MAKKLTKKQFYLLSYTWGLPTTLAGHAVSAALRVTGHKPKRFGWCRYYEVGKGWGGFSLGPVFVKGKEKSRHICEHESGHAIQNCYLGPLMPFLVGLPSSTRYRIHRWKARHGKPLPPYDSVWFEGQATKLGKQYFGDKHVFYEQEQKKAGDPAQVQPEER